MVRTVEPITERITDDGADHVTLRDPDDIDRKQEFDPLFKAPLSIDIAHHEIHEGDSFALFIYEAGIADTDTIEILVQAPAVTSPQKRMHLIAEHEASTEHIFEILEGATYASAGVSATPINRHRSSAKVSALQAAYTGTSTSNIVTGGTPATIWGALHGSGRNVGGGARGVEEWILAAGESYLFRITSAGGGGSSCNAWVGLVWYEHTDG